MFLKKWLGVPRAAMRCGEVAGYCPNSGDIMWLDFLQPVGNEQAENPLSAGIVARHAGPESARKALLWASLTHHPASGFRVSRRGPARTARRLVPSARRGSSTIPALPGAP